MKPTGGLPANRLGVEGGAYALTQMGSQMAPPFAEREETSCRLAPYRVEIADTVFLDPQGTYRMRHWRREWYTPADEAVVGHRSPVDGTLFTSGKALRKGATIELWNDDLYVLRRFAIRGSTLVTLHAKRVDCPERIVSVELVYRRIPQ